MNLISRLSFSSGLHERQARHSWRRDNTTPDLAKHPFGLTEARRFCLCSMERETQQQKAVT
jgi:hypothetical protein